MTAWLTAIGLPDGGRGRLTSQPSTMKTSVWAVMFVAVTSCTPAQLEAPAIDGTPKLAPAHWGACPPGDYGSFGYPLDRMVTDAHLVEWIELSNSAAASGLGNAVLLPGREGALRLPVEESTVRWGDDSPDSVDLADRVIEPVEEAVLFGAHLLIGFAKDSPHSLGGTVLVVALLEASDEAVALGPCGRERWTEPLAQIAHEFDAPSVVDFIRRVVDPTSPEAEFLVSQISG